MNVTDFCGEYFVNNSASCVDFFDKSLGGFFLGTAIGVLIGIGLIFLFFLLVAFYVYHSIVWYKIAKKLKYRNPWLAWVPFGATAMRLQLGGFHWALVFLYLIPVLGWIVLFVLGIIANWYIFERCSYHGALSLLVLIPEVGVLAYLIVMGIVAWGKRKVKK